MHPKEEGYIKAKGVKIAISWGMEDREKELFDSSVEMRRANTRGRGGQLGRER